MFCCVTTRGRNFRVLNGLGRGLGAVTALLLSLGMLGFDAGVLATFGLAASRLPALDLLLAFRILAVALVPRPRLIRASAPFAQADPRPRPARSSGTMGRWLTVASAHGRLVSQGKARGECVSVLPERYPRRERDACLPA